MNFQERKKNPKIIYVKRKFSIQATLGILSERGNNDFYTN